MKLIKKTLLATTILALGQTQAWASNTGSLILRGNVPSLVSILVTPEAVATNLDLSTDQTDLKVATVQEKSNSTTGYSVSISSLNSGTLVRTGGAETFGYTMKYGGALVNLSGVAVFNNATTGSVTANKDVSVSYTGQDFSTLAAGDYEDTITFTIAAN